jgi:hypothetical protein
MSVTFDLDSLLLTVSHIFVSGIGSANGVLYILIY